MLEVHDLTCFIDDEPLFHRVGFTLKRGECLQITGENGAGKTTLLRLISGLMASRTGTVKWQGKCVFKDKAHYWRELVYLGHKPAVKTQLTVRENLHLAQIWGHTNHKAKLEEVLQKVNLDKQQYKLAHTLSAGQLRRLHLARLFLLNAPLWILDEPLTALDKAGVECIERRLKEHLAEGGMVLMTSHQPVSLHSLALRYLPLTVC